MQHFQQTVICLENALGFCNLPQLPIKAFDRVCGIDQTADFLRIFEVGAEFCPVSRHNFEILGYLLSKFCARSPKRQEW